MSTIEKAAFVTLRANKTQKVEKRREKRNNDNDNEKE